MRSVIIGRVLAILFVFYLACYTGETDCDDRSHSSYNILALMPFPGRSHWVVVEPLLIELTKRGHNVTAYGNYPRNHPVPAGYKDIDLRSCSPQLNNLLADWKLDRVPYMTALELMNTFFGLTSRKEDVINCKPLTDLANTREKYDLVMTEYFVADWAIGYAKKLDVPLVGIATGRPFSWLSPYVGILEFPSYIRYGQLTVKDPSSEMSFFERLQNVYNYMLTISYYRYYFEPLNNEIMTALFGNDFPTFNQIAINTSLMLLNSHFSINTIRPLGPSTIEIGSVSVAPKTALPDEIENFISGSKHSVIFFSMGSVLRSNSFPAHTKAIFLEVFSKLPNRIIWKFEETTLPNKPENVLISNWLPQRSILAHPKVELFISHCGQTSLSEAVEEAIPVLAIPIYIDQIDNADTLVLAGAAEKLNFHDITCELLMEKINKMLRNESYKIGAERLSAIYKDRPLPPMDTAMYWIEYVIRHKGAPHLKSPAVAMPWYQYFLLDVIGFLLLIMILSAYVLYITLKLVSGKIRNLFRTVNKKSKTN